MSAEQINHEPHRKHTSLVYSPTSKLRFELNTVKASSLGDHRGRPPEACPNELAADCSSCEDMMMSLSEKSESRLGPEWLCYSKKTAADDIVSLPPVPTSIFPVHF